MFLESFPFVALDDFNIGFTVHVCIHRPIDYFATVTNKHCPFFCYSAPLFVRAVIISSSVSFIW